MSKEYLPADRLDKIYRLVVENGNAKVADLSTMFNVSDLTVRRDLDILEKRGLIERTHGGAICSQRLKVETIYTQKDQEFRIQKEAIGRAAAEFIADGDTILVNSGSTTLQVLRHLKGKHCRVITNNAGALLEARNLDVEILFVGGAFRGQSNSLVGGFAHLTLNSLYGSKAIIGIDGFSLKAGLTTAVYEEADINRVMIERTRGEVIVVADHRKIGVVSNFVSSPAEAIDVLVTDDGFQEEYRNDLEKAGIRLCIAPTGIG